MQNQESTAMIRGITKVGSNPYDRMGFVRFKWVCCASGPLQRFAAAQRRAISLTAW